MTTEHKVVEKNGIMYEVIQSGIIQGKDGNNLSRIRVRMRRTWIPGYKFVQRTYIGDGEKWHWVKKAGTDADRTLIPILNAIGLKTALDLVPTCSSED